MLFLILVFSSVVLSLTWFMLDLQHGLPWIRLAARRSWRLSDGGEEPSISRPGHTCAGRCSAHRWWPQRLIKGYDNQVTPNWLTHWQYNSPDFLRDCFWGHTLEYRLADPFFAYCWIHCRPKWLWLVRSVSGDLACYFRRLLQRNRWCPENAHIIGCCGSLIALMHQLLQSYVVTYFSGSISGSISLLDSALSLI